MLQRLAKQRMPFLIRCARRVSFFPSGQFVIFIQKPVSLLPAPDIEFPLLPIRFLPFSYGRCGTVPASSALAGICNDRQMIIINQLLSGFERGQVKIHLREPDHIPMCATTEAMKMILIQFHAGCAVIVERAAGHSAPIRFQSITLDHLRHGNGTFDLLKDIHIVFFLSRYKAHTFAERLYRKTCLQFHISGTKSPLFTFQGYPFP